MIRTPLPWVGQAPSPVPFGRPARTIQQFTTALSLIILPLASLAEKPSLEHLYPTAIALGETNTISLTGKFDPWPPKIWSSNTNLNFNFPTNKGSVEISAPADAPTGPALIRLYNDEGASDPVIFVVTKTPHLRDTEPNNHFAKPQSITNLPATINGRLEKNNDVDSFRLHLKSGQWLDARLDSHTLMSKIDAVLRLVTTNGYQVAWNHDFASFDPRLVWQSPIDQTVVLQVYGFAYPAGSEIVLSGGNGGIYQLALSVSDSHPADLNAPLTENKNFTNEISQALGVICPAGDEDKFPITLQKDELIELRVDAMEFGSDLDPWIKIEDTTGKELARNDDAEGSRNALLEWKSPAETNYNIVIGSLTHRGEENYRYRLNVQKVTPDFRPTLEANSLVLDSTSTNDLKIRIQRLSNFTNELTVTLSPQIEGLTAEPVKVDSKSTEATLKLITTNSPAFNAPIQILVTDPAQFSLVSRSENNGVPQGYSHLLIESLDHLWLTIKPPKEKAADKAEK